MNDAGALGGCSEPHRPLTSHSMLSLASLASHDIQRAGDVRGGRSDLPSPDPTRKAHNKLFRKRSVLHAPAMHGEKAA